AGGRVRVRARRRRAPDAGALRDERLRGEVELQAPLAGAGLPPRREGAPGAAAVSVATPGRRLALLVIAAALASAPADAAVKPTAGAASTRAAVKPTAGATITRAAAKPTAGGAITRAAAKPRVLSPRARCARAARVARARRRAVLRRACARLRSPRVVGRSVAQEAGLPAALTVPATFAPAPAAVEGSPSPAATPAPATDGTSLP